METKTGTRCMCVWIGLGLCWPTFLPSIQVHFSSQPWFCDPQNMGSIALWLLQDQEGHRMEMLLSKINEKGQLVSQGVKPPLLIAIKAKEKCTLWAVTKLSEARDICSASFCSWEHCDMGDHCSVVVRSPVGNPIFYEGATHTLKFWGYSWIPTFYRSLNSQSVMS